jgi:hypothetical protein
MANLQDIMNCGAFRSRTACDFNESIRVLKTLLAIVLGNGKRCRRRSEQPWMMSLAIRSVERFGDRIRGCFLGGQQSINVESFLIESRFSHHDPFE